MSQKVLVSCLSLLMLMGLSSCGKKANDHKGNDKKDTVENIVSTTIEETHQDLQNAILAGDLFKIQKILEDKTQIDLNKILSDGETLLTTAVRKDNQQIIELLMANGASLKGLNAKDETPVMVSAKVGLETMTRYLISIGSKLDQKDLNGNTALHLAIMNKFEAIALFLINSGINIDITNNDNYTPLRLSEVMGMKKVTDLLKSITQSNLGLPNRTVVRNLLSLGDIDNLSPLFTKFPNIIYDFRDLNMFVLVMNSHDHDKALSMVLMLLGHGSDVNGPVEADETPLIVAVKKNWEDFVSIYLQANANPTILDNNGKSALMWAIERNNPVMVKALINKRAPEKYTYFKDGKKISIKACDVAKETKKTLSRIEDKKANEDIIDFLGCGLRWLF